MKYDLERFCFELDCYLDGGDDCPGDPNCPIIIKIFGKDCEKIKQRRKKDLQEDKE